MLEIEKVLQMMTCLDIFAKEAFRVIKESVKK